ncbi:MAG: protein kinase [Deltaproteobacteria bacterium]|nr:protein kinase [Deltaproteobacteria bacterium]
MAAETPASSKDRTTRIAAEDADDQRPTLVHGAGDGREPEPGQGADRTAPYAPGTQIDHYRIMRLVGQGGMGQIYLARDTKLGRKVALKVIGPEQFDSEQAVERFLFEARITARFNHPNIVTVYGVGEHRGCPYLALEYLEGEHLGTRMATERLSVREALRIGLAVAMALVEAHEHGVLHRDLKPGNVFIGRDGRVPVLDFGLAKVTEPEPRASVPSQDAQSVLSLARLTRRDGASWGFGTPRYMAPEQWREEPCSNVTDVWALGVLLFAMLAHRLPYDLPDLLDQVTAVCGPEPAPRLGQYVDVSAELSDLVAACLAKDQAGRPAAAKVAEQLRALLDAGQHRTDEEQNPFRGLLPFTAQHAHLFFGREAEVASFVERVRLQPVLPVVGPSGAGKSSFVRAGVIPRLLDQEPWTVYELRPGSRPFHTLASRLLGLEPDPSVPTSHLVRPAGLSAAGRPSPSAEPRGETGQPGGGAGSADATPARRGATPEPRTEAAVAELAEQLRARPERLSLELRAVAEARGTKVLLFVDQLEKLFTHGEDPLTQRAFMTALSLATDDVMDPMRVVFTVRDDFLGRLAFGPAVREVLAQVTVIQRPDAAALGDILQKPVDALRHGYEDPGLVTQMVAAVATEPACLPLLQFVARLLWEQRDRKRRLLLRASYEAVGGVEGALARHADGVLAGFTAGELGLARAVLLRLVTAQRTRALVTRERALEGLGPDTAHVLGRLTQARLVSVSRQTDAAGAAARLELAHESLIYRWATLARWIDESREELVFLEEARQAAELWDRRGHRVDELWHGEALADAQRARSRCAAVLPPLVRDFLDASLSRARRRQRRRRAVVASVVVASVLAAATTGLLALLIRQQRDRAEQQRGAALREGARAALGQGRVLEARAKLRESLEIEDSSAARALWWQLRESPLLWEEDLGATIYAVAFDPTGRRLAAAAQDGPVYLFEADTAAVRALRGHRDQVLSVAFSPDGKTLASGSLDRTVRLWSVPDAGSSRVLSGHESGVHGVAFSPDGRLVAGGGYDRTLRIWDVASGREQRVLRGHEGAIRGVDFSRDGQLVASGGADRTVRIWGVQTGALRWVLRGNEREIYGVRFGPEPLLASAGYDGTIRLWDVEEGTQKAVLRGHRGGVSNLAFSADGRRLASGGTDGTARLWDVQGGAQQRQIEASGEIWGVALGPDGRLLATGSADNKVGLRSLAAADQKRAGEGHSGPAIGLALSPDGKVVASAGQDGTIRLWDVRTGDVLRVLRGHAGAVACLAFGPDGARLASGGADRTVRLWDPGTGEEKRVLGGHEAEVFDLAYSPDGRWLASASFDRTVRVWDMPSEALIRVLRGHTDLSFANTPASPVVALLAAPMSTVVAGYGNGLVGLWDLSDGSRLASARLHGPVTHLLLAGQKLYVATDLGWHHIWDLGAFYLDHCSLLEQLWQQVPVVWERGQALARPPPAGHRCRRR